MVAMDAPLILLYFVYIFKFLTNLGDWLSDSGVKCCFTLTIKLIRPKLQVQLLITTLESHLEGWIVLRVSGCCSFLHPFHCSPPVSAASVLGRGHPYSISRPVKHAPVHHWRQFHSQKRKSDCWREHASLALKDHPVLQLCPSIAISNSRRMHYLSLIKKINK